MGDPEYSCQVVVLEFSRCFPVNFVLSAFLIEFAPPIQILPAP